MVTNSILTTFLYSLIPVSAVLAGGIIAIYRVPGKTLRSVILHFAAGVIFSVVAVELLPDVVREHEPVAIVVGFSLGLGAMLGVREWTRRLTQKQTVNPASTARIPWGLLLGIGVDIAIDGLLLGIGFAAGAKEGLLLTLALTIETLSLGLATSTELSQSGVTRRQTLALIASLALVFMVAALGGATLLSGLTDTVLEIILSFSLAALLFLVTEELLVEAHEGEETPALTATFFVGFLIFLILSLVS